VTVVVGGAPPPAAGDIADDELARRVRKLLAEGADRKEAVRQVAEAAGVPRRRVYDATVQT
jgi:16S rRNA (cytidine1402-2'-O)-methyltransferase